MDDLVKSSSSSRRSASSLEPLRKRGVLILLKNTKALPCSKRHRSRSETTGVGAEARNEGRGHFEVDEMMSVVAAFLSASRDAYTFLTQRATRTADTAALQSKTPQDALYLSSAFSRKVSV